MEIELPACRSLGTVTSSRDSRDQGISFQTIEQFDTSGPYVNEFGTTQPGLLAYPQTLAVNSEGDVFVTDTGDNQIVEFAPAAG